MPRLYVDQREVARPHPGATSLEDVLRHVEETHLRPNTVIRQVHIDGMPLISEEFQKDPIALLEGMDHRERIEITTGTVGEIAADAIGEALAYLARVEAITPSLATSFQASPGPEAFENLKQFYDGFYWLNLLIDRLRKSFGLELQGLDIQGRPAQETYSGFVDILKQLVEAQEKEDYILISDLLTYEIIPSLNFWNELFEALATRIPKGS